MALLAAPSWVSFAIMFVIFAMRDAMSFWSTVLVLYLDLAVFAVVGCCGGWLWWLLWWDGLGFYATTTIWFPPRWWGTPAWSIDGHTCYA